MNDKIILEAKTQNNEFHLSFDKTNIYGVRKDEIDAYRVCLFFYELLITVFLFKELNGQTFDYMDKKYIEMPISIFAYKFLEDIEKVTKKRIKNKDDILSKIINKHSDFFNDDSLILKILEIFNDHILLHDNDKINLIKSPPPFSDKRIYEEIQEFFLKRKNIDYEK